MTKELVLYTNPMSRAAIIHWMLEEVGQPYRAELLSYGPAMKSPAYLAINPMGKVPALKHGDTVVTEVAAICAYLADAFPDAKLAPPLAERAAYYRWLFFAAGPLEQAITNRSQGWEPATPELQGRFGYGTYATTLNAFASHLAGRTFIASDTFTAADVYVGSHLNWGMQFGSVEKRPEFVAYWDGLKDRPALKRSGEKLAALAAA